MNLFAKIFPVVLLLFVICVSVITYSMADRHIGVMEEMLVDKHLFLGAMVTSEVQRWQSEEKWPFEALSNLTREDNFHFWWIVDGDGNIHLADDNRFVGTKAATYFNKPESQWFPPTEKARFQFHDTEALGIFSQAFSVGHRQLSVWLGSSTQDIRKASREIVTFALFAALASLVCLGILLFLVIRHYLSPLAKLNDGVRRIGEGDLALRLSGMPNDEVGSLAESVNTMAQQLTEREKALEKAQHYIASIIDSMPSVLIGVEPDGKVTHWNSEAQRVTGITAGNAVGKPLVQAFPRLSTEMARVRRAIQTRQEQINPKRSHHQNGEIHCEDVTIYPLIANDVEGAVIRLDDVTKQVRLEEMMVQSEKMLSVGGLAAGMAHEINNPLAGMMQTAAVMKNRLSRDNLPANQSAAETAGTSLEAIRAYMEERGILRMAEAINASGRRVAEIVDNMLSFARNSHAYVSPHNLAELLDRTLELASTDYDLKKQYDFKTIEIVREYAENLPSVPCEGAKIQQVLLNILRNGAEAMQEVKDRDGKQRFILRLTHEKAADHIRIEIEDNGPGMDEATRRRIFEPFFTTKPVGVGTGLGLSVSYFIITKNHGGGISVESEPGQGARFTVRLPL